MEPLGWIFLLGFIFFLSNKPQKGITLLWNYFSKTQRMRKISPTFYQAYIQCSGDPQQVRMLCPSGYEQEWEILMQKVEADF